MGRRNNKFSLSLFLLGLETSTVPVSFPSSDTRSWPSSLLTDTRRRPGGLQVSLLCLCDLSQGWSSPFFPALAVLYPGVALSRAWELQGRGRVLGAGLNLQPLLADICVSDLWVKFPGMEEAL